MSFLVLPGYLKLNYCSLLFDFDPLNPIFHFYLNFEVWLPILFLVN